MKVRFCRQRNSLVSAAIVGRENIAMPFTPSHVEALSEDGTGYYGAHVDGGVRLRPIGYDATTLYHELILDLGDSPDDAKAFAYMKSKLGQPYDWTSIIDFLLPENWHQMNHLICSAFMALTLRARGYFPYPLAVPAHMISPRDLLLVLSARENIPGI